MIIALLLSYSELRNIQYQGSHCGSAVDNECFIVNTPAVNLSQWRPMWYVRGMCLCFWLVAMDEVVQWILGIYGLEGWMRCCR